MTDIPRRRWRGVEPDARTARRRDLLVHAAIDLITGEGVAGVSVRAVCARAELHSRYFYESFQDLDALLVATFDQLAGDLLTEVTTAAEAVGDDPHTRACAGMQAAVAVVNRNPEVVRFLVAEAVGSEPLNRRRIELLRSIATHIEQEAQRTFGTPPPGERIGSVAARFLVGGLAELLISWIDGDLEGSAEELAQDAMDLVAALTEGTIGIAKARAAARRRSPRRRVGATR